MHLQFIQASFTTHLANRNRQMRITIVNESEAIEAVTAEALRKLGRNIVNFSKIEAAFKYLLAVSQFEEIEIEGIEKTISDQFHRKQTSLSKQSLGRLVSEFNKNVLDDASQSEPTIDSSETGISVSFKVTCNSPDFLKRKKRELLSIVAERNKLIHQDLAFLDPRSVEGYHKLISLLDEQNPRLLAQLEELGGMIKVLEKHWKALENLSISPDFLQYLQSDQTNV